MTEPNSVQFRRATSEDQKFLDEMNIAASFGAIKPESEYPNVDEFLAENPDVAAFSSEFGRLGDIGLIAEDSEGNALGAVWGRQYDRTEHDGVLGKYPFELTIAVKEEARNRGIGGKLLENFAEESAIQGKTDIALGVHYRSPARRLYEAAGFTVLTDENGEEARVGKKYIPMVKKLTKTQ